MKSPERLGHPRGLLPLCVAEGWERFSYSGMQALLVLYMVHYLFEPERIGQVIGMDTIRPAIEWFTGPLSTAALSSQIFGLYTGLVYMTPLLGGIIADRWLPRTLTVTIGALMMAAGHFLMALEATFFIAIALLLMGVGCFKGNIAGQVGELYDRDDLRRATAYQIFQLAISTAVIISPLVCGTLGEKVGWHYGFAAAGVGMLIGLAVYLHGRKWLPKHQPLAAAAPGARTSLSRAEWKITLVLVAMLPILAAAMIGNQQMFNMFIVWGETNFDLMFLGYEMPVTWLISIDAAISVVLLSLAIMFWRWYGKHWKQPEDIVKIAIGAGFMALAPVLLTIASLHQMPGTKISLGWGLGFEILNEIGFVILVPIGLSLFSRAAPEKIEGLTIGMFYLAFFICNVVVGRLGGLLEHMQAADFWLMHAVIVAVATAVLAGLAVWGRGLFVPAEGGVRCPESGVGVTTPGCTSFSRPLPRGTVVASLRLCGFA